MKKSILVGMLVFSLAALMVVGGTLAWFTSEAEVTNTFTAGTVEIEVVEDGAKGSIIENWNPGDTTDYDVSVKALVQSRHM
ncbi:MAG TPA: TasA family protein [Bacillota bacterium]|nr:TasA family protein [Bacillota bacterium]